jgi:hypothetical protein
VNEFYCKFIKKPFDKRGLSKLRMMNRVCSKTEKNKQTKERSKESEMTP